MTDGSLVIDTALDTSGVDLGINKVKSSLSKLTRMIAVGFSLKSLINFGKQSIELASNITEVDNVVEKAFGSMRQEVDDFANSAIESLGMSRLTAYKTSSTFMSMGKSMMSDQVAAKNMALELTKLTGNMSSFFNVSQDLASIALKSIYTGETETLKQYGVVMTEVNLKEFALSQGITKSYNAMTQSEKVMLRYKYVMSQLSFIGDDFIDTQDSWANQTRILTEQWKEFMSIVGQNLINILTPAIKILNQIVAALINVANAISAVMNKMGIKSQPIQQASKAYEDLTDSVEGYGNAVESASKKAKKGLANFDELNNISSSSSAGSSAGGVASFDIADFSNSMAAVETQTNKWIDDFTNKLVHLKDMFKEGFFENLGTDYQKTAQKIINNSNKIKDTIKDIFSDPNVSSSLQTFNDTVIKSFGELSGSISKFGLTIAHAFTSSISETLEKEAPEIKNIISDLFSESADLIKVLSEVADFVLNTVLAPIMTYIISKFVPRITNDIETLLQFVTVVISKVKGLLEGQMQVLKGLIKFVKGVFTSDWKMAWNGIKDVVSGVKRSLSSIVNGMIGVFEVMINAIIRGVNRMIDSLNKISFTVPDWIPEVGGKKVGFDLTRIDTIRLPKLASGAVIPANQPFAAILGDQKSGTNIETPLNTMIEAFNIAFDAKQSETNQILSSILTALIEKETGITKRELFESVRSSAREFQHSTGRYAF